MGFLSSTTKSKSGYNALPPALQNAVVDAVDGARHFIAPWHTMTGVQQQNIDRFTPLAETADETRAYDMMRAGFTPTAQTLGADLSMLENPYNQYVISEINRQSQGNNSILRQALNESGQFGSNRSILGANDIDLSRQNQIGTFLSDQFNRNLGYALNQLPALRQNDAANLATIGGAQRELDYARKQAPVTALQALANINNVSGLSSSVGQTAESKTSGGGFGSVLSAVGSGLAALGTGGASLGLSGLGGGMLGGLTGTGLGAGQLIGSAFSGSAMGPYLPYGISDARVKENLVKVGDKNGIPIYEYNYEGSDQKYRGVMAQDVLEIVPDAVMKGDDGLYRVNYDMIGIPREEVQ